MKARWLVAKYMSDLRRREPVNVGVILTIDDQVLSRFIGQRPDGSIDGRRVNWVTSVPTYKAWIQYWRHAITPGIDHAKLPAALGDENYVLEWGGERIAGGRGLNGETLLDYVYGVLVEDAPDRNALTVMHLSESLFHRLEISEQVVRGYTLEVTRPGGSVDSIDFDYRYDNGAPNLMQRIALIHEDERSWDSAHAAAWSFEQAADHDVDGARPHLLALVKTRARDSALRAQMSLLGDYASVVDVSDEEQAVGSLREHLGIPSKLTLR